jgi:hypothetical protein
MGFELKIELGNAAMRTRRHVAEALRKVAKRLADAPHEVEHAEIPILDANGNTVGRWSYEPEKP